MFCHDFCILRAKIPPKPIPLIFCARRCAPGYKYFALNGALFTLMLFKSYQNSATSSKIFKRNTPYPHFKWSKACLPDRAGGRHPLNYMHLILIFRSYEALLH